MHSNFHHSSTFLLDADASRNAHYYYRYYIVVHKGCHFYSLRATFLTYTFLT